MRIRRGASGTKRNRLTFWSVPSSPGRPRHTSRTRPRKRGRGSAPRSRAPAPARRRTSRIQKQADLEPSQSGSALDAPTGTPAVATEAKSAEVHTFLYQSHFFQCCGICLDTVKEQGVLTVCPHVFCFDCIMTWSKTANTCPVCKRAFNEIRPIGANGKRPSRRKAKYAIKNRQQTWEPSREELLRAAGLFDDESSGDDDSYDPDDFAAEAAVGEYLHVDPRIWHAPADADNDFHIQLLEGEEENQNEVIEIEDDSSEDSFDDYDLLATALASNLVGNFALAVAASLNYRGPAAAGVVPPEVLEQVRRPQRFRRR